MQEESKGRNWNGKFIELIDFSHSFAVVPFQRTCLHEFRNRDPCGGRLAQISANDSNSWTGISEHPCSYQIRPGKQHKINRQVCVCCHQCLQA